MQGVDAWPTHGSHKGDFDFGATVAECSAHVQQGFLRKVFGLVAAQLAATAALSAAFCFVTPVRDFALSTPSMILVSFFSAIVCLGLCASYKDNHPTNLYCLGGFTLSMAWLVGTVCARFYAAGLGLLVIEAVGLTASITAGLTIYTLRSKADFSYLGAGLGTSLWMLIVGGLLASFTAAPGMHMLLAIGGACIFSLYIVYDVYLISRRMSPDEYIPAAISLYLDITNLFLKILQILAEVSGNGRD